MKMVKSLLLGSAATLVAVAGAQAADLPVKAKAVEYVKVCSLYGAGFYYVPGTDTCLKIGGYVRADYYYHQNAGIVPHVLGADARGTRTDTADSYTRARLYTSWDWRTQTEYGTLRAFARMGAQGASAGAVGTSYSAGNGFYANAIAIDRAFIQFAGFTFGKTISFHHFADPHAYSSYVFWSDDATYGT
ncbi:MAG: porin, partial [Pseudorhodoplanes sp.]